MEEDRGGGLKVAEVKEVTSLREVSYVSRDQSEEGTLGRAR